MQRLLTFLFFEAATFVLAALVHAGLLAGGYQHAAARNAETALAVVLLAGAAIGIARPSWARGAAIAAQGFALLGVAVGLFTIAVGVGPRTAPDVVYHLAIAAVLAWGLTAAIRLSGTARAPGR